MNLEPARDRDSERPSLEKAAALVGRVIAGRYRVDAALGREHFKAAMVPLERPVALRILPAGRGCGEQFARVAGRLTHPNTVRLIDFGRTEDGTPFVAMEYLNGRTLGEVLAEGGALSQVRAIHIAQQICRSLREAHALNIVHRGLRPSSVMLLRQQDEQDFAKLMDFGVGPSAPGEKLALLSAVAANYLAPEQARNQQADARSDVYALGVLLYEMLTGRVPFSGATATEVIVRHLAEQPLAPRAARPDLGIDESLERIVLRCLSKDRAARYSSMDELLGQLKLVRARLTQTRIDMSTMPPMLASELSALGYGAPPPPAIETPLTVTPVGTRFAPEPSAPRFAAIAARRSRTLTLIAGACAVIAAGGLVLAALREDAPPLSAAAAKVSEPIRAAPMQFGK